MSSDFKQLNSSLLTIKPTIRTLNPPPPPPRLGVVFKSSVGVRHFPNEHSLPDLSAALFGE